jgi:hypothetical protein
LEFGESLGKVWGKFGELEFPQCNRIGAFPQTSQTLPP